MQTYGIDGALVQRFTGSIPGHRKEGDTILRNVRTAAEAHGRVFAVEYDMSGAHDDTIQKRGYAHRFAGCLLRCYARSETRK